MANMPKTRCGRKSGGLDDCNRPLIIKSGVPPPRNLAVIAPPPNTMNNEENLYIKLNKDSVEDLDIY
jgi:hypothetical protein